MSKPSATGNDAVNPVAPFRLITDRDADFDIADALQFLIRSPGGEESAIRFSERYDEAVRDLCQAVADEIAETGRYFKRVDVAASAYKSRPTFRLDIQTSQKRARRSNSGLWYVYYTINDTDGDAKPDAITVTDVVHSGSEPYAINTGQFDLPNDESDPA